MISTNTLPGNPQQNLTYSLYIFKSSLPFLKLKIQLYYSKMLIVLTSVIIEVLLTAKYDTSLTLREPTWKFQTSIRP